MCVFIQDEVAGIEQDQPGIRQVAQIRLCPGGDEKRIVSAPDDQRPRDRRCPHWGRARETVSVPVRPRFAVNTADAAIAAAIASAGITRVLSYQVHAPVADGRLRLILRPFEPEPVPVHLVYAEQSLLPLKLRAFLDFATPA